VQAQIAPRGSLIKKRANWQKGLDKVNQSNNRLIKENIRFTKRMFSFILALWFYIARVQ
jgi:hypothetical protein